ncbi:GNAT family N-acetyltransferase [Pseudonocardia sp. T1-2H]|uniref:GNAT family N-acetyltransferase n=1 Tax=Pseudonocardia sp. T1-2H TaxID=3128899 RepID=UPI0031010A8B
MPRRPRRNPRTARLPPGQPYVVADRLDRGRPGAGTAGRAEDPAGREPDDRVVRRLVRGPRQWHRPGARVEDARPGVSAERVRQCPGRGRGRCGGPRSGRRRLGRGLRDGDPPPGAGRGAARSILASLAGWATARGADGIYLQVESDNDPALRLYDNTGFTEVCGYHYRTQSPSPIGWPPRQQGCDRGTARAGYGEASAGSASTSRRDSPAASIASTMP